VLHECCVSVKQLLQTSATRALNKRGINVRGVVHCEQRLLLGHPLPQHLPRRGESEQAAERDRWCGRGNEEVESRGGMNLSTEPRASPRQL